MALYRRSKRDGVWGYQLNYTLVYRDKKTGKTITAHRDYWSDGATFAEDIFSESWWYHDVVCERGTWDDGTPINNWDASRVLATVLWRERRWVRAVRWGFWTWVLGGGKARENGMFTSEIVSMARAVLYGKNFKDTKKE